MRSLIRRRAKNPCDPAPSRWSWRMQRLFLTPAFLLLLRAGVPLLALAAGVLWYVSDPARLQKLSDTVAETRASFEQRPEFMVNLLVIDGAGDRLSEDIRKTLPLILPVSSFDIDPSEIRDQVRQLDPVKSASVRIRPGGILQIDVVPRVPAVVWRGRGGLVLLDETGSFIRPIARRAARSDLPVIAGDGADGKVQEALELVDAALPLSARFVGLERIGMRRWDVVLEGEQRILLPEENPVEALERALTLNTAQDILSRDVLRVDLRLGQRPTVRMSEFATETWWSIRQTGQSQ